MKIAFAMWSTARTGGTNSIFNVADRLAKLGHEVRIISLGAKNHTWFKFKRDIHFYYPEEKLLSHLWIKFRNRRLGTIELLDWVLRKIHINLFIDRCKILSEALNEYARDADAVIATYFETAFSVNRMNSEKCKKFYYIQHIESFFFNDVYNKKRVHETYFLPFKWMISSSWANSKLVELTGKIGNIVIPGIDTSVYYPRHIDKNKNYKIIVSLGKSMNIKGLKFLFEALNKVSRQISNIKLILYGVEPSLRMISPVTTEYIISPTNDRLAELYSIADVMVTPSLYESSPSPPIEAMACGAPVVTTKFGTEDYCFDGENSLVVPPEDADALAEAILRVLSDSNLASKLRENGLRKSKELSWDSTAQNFEKVLLKTIGQNL